MPGLPASSYNSCGSSLNEMKLEKDPISAPPGMEELMDCFDLLSVHDVRFERGCYRQKETDNELVLWFDMPGLSLEHIIMTIDDKTSMTFKGEGYLSNEYVDGSLNDDGRERVYGGILRFPENQFDLVAADVGVEMKNGVLKLVVPKLKPTHQQLQETAHVLLPKTKKQKLEEEPVLARLKQLLEEQSTDVFHVNVE